MHVLVVSTPKPPIPPSELDWHERHKDEFTAFGLFPGGAIFGQLREAVAAQAAGS